MIVATASQSASQMWSENCSWGGPPEDLARPIVEALLDGQEAFSRMHREVSTLRKILSKETVGVLVRAALPGTGCIGKEDSSVKEKGDLGVACHLATLIPCQRKA